MTKPPPKVKALIYSMEENRVQSTLSRFCFMDTSSRFF